MAWGDSTLFSPLSMRDDWMPMGRPRGDSFSNTLTGVTPSPIPSNDSIPGAQIVGGGPIHVTLVVGGTNMVYQVHHKLKWAPQHVWAIREAAEGAVLGNYYSVISITGGPAGPPFPEGALQSGVINMAFSQSGTWDIWYC